MKGAQKAVVSHVSRVQVSHLLIGALSLSLIWALFWDGVVYKGSSSEVYDSKALGWQHLPEDRSSRPDGEEALPAVVLRSATEPGAGTVNYL